MHEDSQQRMAQAQVGPAGIETISGALKKPKKENGHSHGSYLVMTHRKAATTNPNCQRIYSFAADRYARKTQPTAVELAARERFRQVAAMVATRAKDLNRQPADQAAFKAQSVYTTMKSYLWHVCGEEWDEEQG